MKDNQLKEEQKKLGDLDDLVPPKKLFGNFSQVC